MFKRFIDFNRKYIFLAISGFLLIAGILGYRLINPTIGVDTEMAIAAYNETLNCYLGNGRFFCAFLRKLIMPFGYNYYLAFLLAIFFLYIAFSIFVFSLHDYGMSKTSSLAIFGILFFSSPVFSEVFYFANQSDVIAIGMLLTACSSYMICESVLHKKGILYLLIGSILGVFSVGCYQAFFYLLISEILSYSILHIIYSEEQTSRQYWIYAAKLIATIIIIVISYFILSSLIRVFLFNPDLKYAGVNSAEHIANSVAWKNTSFIDCLKSIRSHIADTLYFRNTTGGLFTYTVLFIILSGLFCKGIKEKNYKFIYAACLFAALSITPFLGAIVKGKEIALREQIILPFVSAFCIAFSLGFFFKKSNLIKKILIVITLYMSWYQTLATLNMFHTDQLRYEFDKSTMQQIIQDVESNYGSLKDKVIVYDGIISWSIPEYAPSSIVIGHSILEWDGTSAWGANYRINYFSKSLGLTNNIPTPDQIEKGFQLTENLDTWPAENSMNIEGNIIAVKLSD